MRNVVAGLMVGLGVAAGGYFVGNGFVEGRVADRHVTVRGLSERDVGGNSLGDSGLLQHRRS